MSSRPTVVGVHRANMVVLGRLSYALVGDLQALLGIGRKPDSFADRGIVEGLVVDLHAGNRSLGSHHLVNVDVLHRLVDFKLLDIALIDAVHIPFGTCPRSTILSTSVAI
jgi:hypothetical protein